MHKFVNIAEYLLYKIQKFLLKLLIIIFIFSSVFLIIILPIAGYCFLAEYFQKKYILINPYIDIILIIGFFIFLLGYIFVMLFLWSEGETIIRKFPVLLRIENYPNILLFLIERKHALFTAREFIEKYTDIRKNLKLRNKNFIITLYSDATTIECSCLGDKNYVIKTTLKPYYKSSRSGINWEYVDVWNILCHVINPYMSFSQIVNIFTANNYSISYENLYTNLNVFQINSEEADVFDQYKQQFPELSFELTVDDSYSENIENKIKIDTDAENYNHLNTKDERHVDL